MKKIISKLLIIMTIPMLFIGCRKDSESQEDKLKVAVSISPLR